VHAAEIAQGEVALHPIDGVGREQRLARLRERLHALGETDRLALGGVVHAQVVADASDDDLARVESHAHGEVEPVLDAQRVGVGLQGLGEMERRVAGPVRVILVGDRRAEERHDAVARVLIDGALEAVHALGENLEEAIEHAVPLFGVELLGELE